MRKQKPIITAEQAREVFSYDPATGKLTYRIDTPNYAAGTEAGAAYGDGYLKVGILGRCYPVHRLIWLIVTGAWPVHVIDHINRVRGDNRWENLRDVTLQENARNHRPRRPYAEMLAAIRAGGY